MNMYTYMLHLWYPDWQLCVFCIHVFCTESRPELDAMKKLQIGSKTPFDVIQKIGVHYKDVGIWLLEDDDGSKVANIADEIGCSFDSVVICAKIIEQWTQREEGRATWEELERCIRDARLTVLADDMMEVLQSESVAILFYCFSQS